MTLTPSQRVALARLSLAPMVWGGEEPRRSTLEVLVRRELATVRTVRIGDGTVDVYTITDEGKEKWLR